MKQKVFMLNLEVTDLDYEVEFPDALDSLLEDGWFIKQISSIGLSYSRDVNGMQQLALLLQKDED